MKKSVAYFAVCSIALVASLIAAYVINSQTATGLGALTNAGYFTVCLVVAVVSAAALGIGIGVVLVRKYRKK